MSEERKCKVISVSNQKGGTAKTVSCVNFGIGLAKEGCKVLLIDADPQGSMTISLGYPEPDEMDYTLANIELSAIEVSLVNVMSRELILKQLIELIKDDYDYIIIDCMPSLGMMTINALACADSVLITVQEAYLPVKGLQQLIRTIGRVKRQLNPRLATLTISCNWSYGSFYSNDIVVGTLILNGDFEAIHYRGNVCADGVWKLLL